MTRDLAKHQPCGCVVCSCEDQEQCHGCGAKHCGTHPIGEFSSPVFREPRFQTTYCSQCGGEFGPGDEGYSHCSDHAQRAEQEIARAIASAGLASDLILSVRDYGKACADELPESQARWLDDVEERIEKIQQDSYADGRKDEREELVQTWRAFIRNMRDHIGAGGYDNNRQHELSVVGPYLDSLEDELSELDESGGRCWYPIETAPEDEHILIATTGGHVGTAFWTDEGDGKVWAWGHPERDGGQYVHANLSPLKWMPLPKHPEAA